MDIKLDENKLRQRLEDAGFDDDDQDAVLDIVREGLDLTVVSPTVLEFPGAEGPCKITVFNRKGTLETDDVPPFVSSFYCSIPGIDSRTITRVEIPPLDYSSCEPFQFSVRFLPCVPPDFFTQSSGSLLRNMKGSESISAESVKQRVGDVLLLLPPSLTIFQMERDVICAELDRSSGVQLSSGKIACEGPTVCEIYASVVSDQDGNRATFYREAFICDVHLEKEDTCLRLDRAYRSEDGRLLVMYIEFYPSASKTL